MKLLVLSDIFFGMNFLYLIRKLLVACSMAPEILFIDKPKIDVKNILGFKNIIVSIYK